MSSLPPDFPFLELDNATICPSPSADNLFIPYFNRLYENIALSVNARDFIYFTAPITDKATNIPNMANFGAFLLCVSGATTGMPAYVWALTKADQSAAGVGFVALTSQVGTVAPWVAATLTISSTGTNFQIRHSVAATIGNFNFRFIGTQ
jgi:hypothetical protein